MSRIILPDPDYDFEVMQDVDMEDDYEGTSPFLPDPDYEERQPMNHFVSDFRQPPPENRENGGLNRVGRQENGFITNGQQRAARSNRPHQVQVVEDVRRPKFTIDDYRDFTPFKSVKNGSPPPLDPPHQQRLSPSVFSRQRRSPEPFTPAPRSPEPFSRSPRSPEPFSRPPRSPRSPEPFSNQLRSPNSYPSQLSSNQFSRRGPSSDLSPLRLAPDGNLPFRSSANGFPPLRQSRDNFPLRSSQDNFLAPRRSPDLHSLRSSPRSHPALALQSPSPVSGFQRPPGTPGNYYTKNTSGSGRYKSKLRKLTDSIGSSFGRSRLNSAPSLTMYENGNRRLQNGVLDDFESASLRDFTPRRPRQRYSSAERQSSRVRAPALYKEEEEEEEKDDNPALAVDGDIENSNSVRVVKPYSARNTDELTSRIGEKLQVLEKRVVWWRCKNAFNEEGWIPARHLCLVPEDD